MKKIHISVILLLISLYSSTLAAVSFSNTQNNSVTKEQAEKWIQHRPVRFMENKGQMTDMNKIPVPFVLYRASTQGVDMYITEKGLTYVFIKMEEREEEEADSHREEHVTAEWSRIDMILDGASIKKENVVKEGMSKNFSQYFFTHCPDGIKDVHSYEKIIIKEIYPGIDWVLYNSNEKGFKYDFIVHPGADASRIALTYNSLKPLHMDKTGNLSIKTKLGKLTENAPYSFIKESSKVIKTNFFVADQKHINKKYYETKIKFEFPDQNLSNSQTLIIDPQLFWATFYGGGAPGYGYGTDGANGITTDMNGNLFITGYSMSMDFPVFDPGTGAYFNSTYNFGGADATIMKFNNTGECLWATYYGGSGSDGSNSICADQNGNIFITGFEGGGFPLFNPGTGAYFQGGGGWLNAFILKFDNAGNRLWATRYGGPYIDRGNAITTDPNGNVYVTGMTDSSSFPVLNLSGAYNQSLYGGGTGSQWAGDAFLLKFNNNGVRLWATYIGGNGNETAQSVCTDLSGNVYVTGNTPSSNFPIQNLAGAYNQPNNAGGSDIFISKFNSTGALTWSTYYGGSANDEAYSIAADPNGNVFVTGLTVSTNFPVQNLAGAYNQAISGGGACDAFILKFSNTGAQLWGTYYGGSGMETFDINKSITIDICNNVYVSYTTSSSDIFTQSPCDSTYYDNTFNGGGNDIFISKFTNDGVLLWASYFGGDGFDFRTELALDPSNNLFITGEWTGVSNSNTYPLTNPGGNTFYDASYNGDHDWYIAKFLNAVCDNCTVLYATGYATPIHCNGESNGTATALPSNGVPPYSYLWSNNQTSKTINGLSPGVYTCVVKDSVNDSVVVNVTVTEPTVLTSTASQLISSCDGLCLGTATVGVSGGTPPYSYLWTTGATSLNVINLCPGIDTVVVTDFKGCKDTSAVTINSIPSPVAAITGDTIICKGESTTLIASGGGTYNWHTGDTVSSLSITPAVDTVYSVIVLSNGCSDTAITNISVLPIPIANITGDSTICVGESTTLNASGGGTYSWSSGDTTVSITVSTNTTYTLVVTNANNCKDTATATVTVFPLPNMIVSGNDTICEGNSAMFTASGANITSYSWNTGATNNSITVSPAVNSTYTVTGTDNNGCKDTNSVALVIEPTAIANFTPNPTEGQIPLTVNFTNVSMNAGMYQWDFGDGSIPDTTFNPQHIYTEGGEYMVQLIANNSYDCPDTTIYSFIQAEATSVLWIPNSFSPNADGINDLFMIQTSGITSIDAFIFNRWGELLYEWHTLTDGWDGKYKNNVVEEEVYVYVVKAKGIDGVIYQKTGHVSLIR